MDYHLGTDYYTNVMGALAKPIYPLKNFGKIFSNKLRQKKKEFPVRYMYLREKRDLEKQDFFNFQKRINLPIRENCSRYMELFYI